MILPKKRTKDKKGLSGEPYFIHVFETAKILAKFGMDTQTIVAGLLHDTLGRHKNHRRRYKKRIRRRYFVFSKGSDKTWQL